MASRLFWVSFFLQPCIGRGFCEIGHLREVFVRSIIWEIFFNIDPFGEVFTRSILCDIFVRSIIWQIFWWAIIREKFFFPRLFGRFLWGQSFGRDVWKFDSFWERFLRGRQFGRLFWWASVWAVFASSINRLAYFRGMHRLGQDWQGLLFFGGGLNPKPSSLRFFLLFCWAFSAWKWGLFWPFGFAGNHLPKLPKFFAVGPWKQSRLRFLQSLKCSCCWVIFKKREIT